MKRKTIILLSSVLAGSLLVGGAFAAYLVTDLAQPKVIDITPGQAPSQDYVTLEWGEQTTYTSEFDEIEANKYYKAGYFVIKSDVAYDGIFSVKMQNTTIGKLEGEDMFDHIKLYAYQGDVNLEEEAIPSTAVPFTFEDPEEGEGVVTYSKLVSTTSEGVGITIFYRLECNEDQFAEMANDHVRLTVDWNMGPDSEPANLEAGYYLVGIGDDWTLKAEYKLQYTVVPHGEDPDEIYYSIADVDMAEGEKFKVRYDGQGVAEQDVKWYGDDDNVDDNGNLVAPRAGKYTVLFTNEERNDWATGETYESAYGVNKHFWIIAPEADPQSTGFAIYDVNAQAAVVNLVADGTDSQGRDQYSGVASLTANQVITIRDLSNSVNFLSTVEGYSFGGTTAESENWKEYLEVTEAGWKVLQDVNVNIYAKFQMNNDAIYFGIVNNG